MERKNMVLLTVIASATLLVAVVGATFAYFSITVTNTSSAGQTGGTNVSSGQVAGSVVVANVSDDAGSFTATNVYPGHKEVADFSVAVTGSQSGVTTNYELSYNVTANTFSSGAIKVSLYEADTEVADFGPNFFECTQQTGTIENGVSFFETCTKDEKKLTGATLVGSVQTLTGGTQTVDFGTRSITGDGTKYYYVVVDFPNDGEATQNTEQNKTLTGDIDVDVVL